METTSNAQMTTASNSTAEATTVSTPFAIFVKILMETTPQEAEINTSSNSTTEGVVYPTASTPFAILAKTLMVIAIIPNLFLNPLMLVTLRRVTSIQPTTKIFMASLTLCDLCRSLWGILILTSLLADTWLLGSFLCAANQVMLFLFTALSVSTLLLLTVDRYIAVSHPLRYPSIMTVFKSKIIVCSTWATNIVSSILINGINPFYTTLVIGHNKRLCVAETYDWRVYLILVLVVLQLLTIFIMYARIAMIARNQARRIAAENQAGNGQGGQRINTRSTTTIIIITGTLIITWIPTLIRLAIASQNQWEPYVNYLAYISTEAMLLSNGWMNVIIYYLRNKDLRQALLGLLTDWRQRLSQRFRP
ncbi:beta-2 adrenergic receptor-like [Patiria miniata]|uniref:G-protein coupled receptors family 1 profile domain-containing protein n=1 Tax=Patiria miniata TaxID=46514 RepID=A0A913ZTE9_PATMI|nr:beta-2 adrenergic receptor-like [Patiria miniata]